MLLKDISSEHILFEINHNFNPEQIDSSIDYGITLKKSYEEETRTLVVGVRVSTPENALERNSPFVFDVSYRGVFEFRDNPDGKTLEQASDINCPTIIFPYVRELVADIVRRAGFPPLLLPTVNFVEMRRRSQEENNLKKNKL